MDICSPPEPPSHRCRRAHSTSPAPGQRPPRLHQWIWNPPQLLPPGMAGTVSKSPLLPRTEFLFRHRGEGCPATEVGGWDTAERCPLHPPHRPRPIHQRRQMSMSLVKCSPETTLGSVPYPRPMIKPTQESWAQQSREG